MSFSMHADLDPRMRFALRRRMRALWDWTVTRSDAALAEYHAAREACDDAWARILIDDARIAQEQRKERAA